MGADRRQPGSHRRAQPGGLPRGHRQQPVRHRPRAVRDERAQRHAREDAHGAGTAGRTRRGGVLLPAYRRGRLRMPQAPLGHAGTDQRALRHRAARRADRRRFAARPRSRRGGRLRAAPGAQRQGPEDARQGRAAARHAGARRPARLCPLADRQRRRPAGPEWPEWPEWPERPGRACRRRLTEPAAHASAPIPFLRPPHDVPSFPVVRAVPAGADAALRLRLLPGVPVHECRPALPLRARLAAAGDRRRPRHLRHPVPHPRP
ncbi:Phosphatase (modular protein) [Cupriavidus taiwanensis]|nr:Phosphatase (modular protein) [Cupriavidus taiwanensis]